MQDTDTIKGMAKNIRHKWN